MQRRLRSFVESMIHSVQEPLLIIDSHHTVQIINTAFCEHFNLCPLEAIGQSFFSLGHDQWNIPILKEKIQQVIDDNMDFDALIVQQIAPDKGPRSLQVNAKRLDIYGKNSLFESDLILIGVEDFSARKRADLVEEEKLKAECANRTKSSFLANLSHEIRTPLSSILGFADLLGRDFTDDSPHSTYVQIIRKNARHLLELVGEVLDLSKIEAQKLDLITCEVHLASEIYLVFDILTAKANEKNLSLEFDRAPNTPEVIFTDPTRFRQILINLLNNAIKFTASGGIKVYSKLSEQGLLQLSVVDTGMGIPAEIQSQIFDQFTQAKSSSGSPLEGTGLGLTLSRELARLLGGDIVLVRSEVGFGSQFDIFIDPGSGAKLTHSSKSAQTFPSRSSIHKYTSLKGLKILLAEDGIDTQALFKQILEHEGAVVDIVDNGAHAIALAQEAFFDVILMDQRMPIIDGLEATSTLRAKGYSRPILALTANAIKEEREASLAAGCNDFLCKPIDGSTLCNAIAYWARSANHPSENIS